MHRLIVHRIVPRAFGVKRVLYLDIDCPDPEPILAELSRYQHDARFACFYHDSTDYFGTVSDRAPSIPYEHTDEPLSSDDDFPF